MFMVIAVDCGGEARAYIQDTHWANIQFCGLILSMNKYDASICEFMCHVNDDDNDNNNIINLRASSGRLKGDRRRNKKNCRKLFKLKCEYFSQWINFYVIN